MTEEVTAEATRRGRPPKSAAAEVNVASVETPEPRMVEVRLVRKYVPFLCYEPDENGSPILVRHPENGSLMKQAEMVVGQKYDKFGRTVPVYREILDAWPEGTKIELPLDEAKRAIENGVAKITDRTL